MGALGLALSVAQARAESGERPYNPAVGSRWTIQSQSTEEDDDNGTIAVSTTKFTAQLKIDARTPEGFKVVFIRTDSSYDGDPEAASVERAALIAQQGVIYDVVSDAAGKPVRVENLDQAITVRKMVINGIIDAPQDPNVQKAARQMLNALLKVDASNAAEEVLSPLPDLATAQNTGLKPGEERRSIIAPRSAAGFAKTSSLSLVNFDATSGEAHLRRSTTADPESMRAMMTGLYGTMSATDPTEVAKLIDAVKHMELSQVDQVDFDVIDGMTRRMESVSTTRRRLANNQRTVTTRTVVTVSPAT